MSSKRGRSFVLTTVVTLLFLGACAAPPTPATIIQTVEVPVTVAVQVTVPVVQTVQVPVTNIPPATATPQAGKTVIIWWSHWANEPLRRQVIEKVVADYEAANPNVDIILSWWDIAALQPALRAVMAAGEGQPDISTDADLATYAKAGLALDLTDALDWDRFLPGMQDVAGVPGVDGLFKFNIAIQQLMLFYNKDIFAKLGIEVPADLTFTQSEFVDVVKKCRAGGYAGVADASGNRAYPGMFPIWAGLTNLEGATEEAKYNNGFKLWDTDTARQMLNWDAELSAAGMWPDTYSTMTIDEFHVFFHTQQKSCMLYIPSWYTGRAFKPVDQGGQSPDFHFGMLNYPLMDGATHPDELWANGDSGYMIMKTSKHPEIATDILKFLSQPKYAALWTATTLTPSALKYDAAKDWPTDVKGAEQWQWYFDEMNQVYGSKKFVITTDSPCGDFLDARSTALNQGIPLGLMSVDDAIKLLDAHQCPAP
ncbi:MAG: extracellular solute-binding protein [Anaerolineales bacterium]